MGDPIINFIGHLPVANLPYDDTVMLLSNGAKVSTCPGSDGKELLIQYPGGKNERVLTIKLMTVLIEETARIYSTTEGEGGKPADQFKHLMSHFSVKTGFDL